MNQMEQLEIQLRAWQPRRPSAKCRTAIFGRKFSGAHRVPLQIFWQWSLPVAACVVLLLGTLSQRAGELSRVARLSQDAPMFAAALSNQSFVAFFAGNERNEQNSLRNTFEWTNASRYTPSIAPLIH